MKTTCTFQHRPKPGSLAWAGLARFAVCLWLGLALMSTAAVAQQPPNVVVIMTDDLSEQVFDEASGRGFLPTIASRLVNQGTRFRQSFTTQSLCCPSRATFLTGQYTHNHGVESNTPPDGSISAFDDRSTLATWLDAAGYRTGYVGKYLNGYGSDRNRRSPLDDPTYVPPGWDDWQALITGTMYNYVLNDNGTLIDYGEDPAEPPEEYQTDVLAERAVAFVDAAATAPFFLTVAPVAPHFEVAPGVSSCRLFPNSLRSIRPAPRHQGSAGQVPLPQGTAFNEQDVTDKPTWVQAAPLLSERSIDCLGNIYRDQIESLRAVDDLTASLIAALERRGVLGNTIVVFTSDNGYLFGQHRLTGKNVIYEESIRVPLVVRLPGSTALRLIEQLAVNIDLAPTIAAWAGATPTLTVDGRSLVPLLANPELPGWRKRFLLEHGDVRGSGNSTGVRTGSRDTEYPNTVFIQFDNGERELYALDADPAQLESRHLDQPDTAAALGALASELRLCSGTTCRELEDQ
ncbi:sulfatase family protein [Gloeobacter violaceus]|uniref:Gll0646 protein n=1 Tax=Gloeobacter violaceus (strain ATCC 29082 / PCC 7421) TaxID=251221 RepID=Q7NMW9_GLOVI|nr:sulfatase [Gloeobacter violaceus]BAC88587.1 gll0646 [Gloeobacter violaceus PCC 7421]